MYSERYRYLEGLLHHAAYPQSARFVDAKRRGRLVPMYARRLNIRNANRKVYGARTP